LNVEDADLPAIPMADYNEVHQGERNGQFIFLAFELD